MIELNHILLFIAIISPVAVLFRTWRSPTVGSWRVSAYVVLIVTGLALLVSRNNAGYVGAGAWFVLLFLPAVGLKRVADLSAAHRYTAARQLSAALQFLHPSQDLRSQTGFFRQLEARQAEGLVPGPLPSSSGWPRGNRLSSCWAVTTVLIVNAICFAIEGRSSTNVAFLTRIGALDPVLVIWGHQYWRLATALFLHYGILHLFFNLFALYVIGPGLERAIGGVRFLFCYLVSGLGSTAGVILLTVLHVIRPAQLVGASGCVMGVVGALAGFFLRHRDGRNSRARLQNILAIIAIQVLFDISTPQVSMSAHLCGLATGFLIGVSVL